MSKWHKYLMAMAEHAASLSKDGSTRVGCVLVGQDRNVLSTGFNGMPMGVDDDRQDRHERPAKYRYFEHAERNAIYLAARAGTALKGATAYIHPWPPCPDCARGLIQAGIRQIVVPMNTVPARWLEDMRVAQEMLREAGVEILELESEVEDPVTKTMRKITATMVARVHGLLKRDEESSERSCANCAHLDTLALEDPCRSCSNYSNWEEYK